MHNIGFGVLAVVASAVVAVTPAFAQRAKARPSGGLFGATRSDAAGGNHLNVIFGLNTAHDSDVPPQLLSTGPSDSQIGGFSTILVGTADYAYTRRRLHVAGTASTAFRYYNQLDLFDAVGHGVGLGASIRLPKTATVEVEQNAAYSPSYVYQLFPALATPTLGEAIPASPDYRVEQTDSYQYASRMTFGIGSPRGTRLSASGTYDRTQFGQQLTPRPDLKIAGAGAKLGRGIRRNVSVSSEYEYRTGEFGLGGRSTEHRLAVGADYSRPLSGGRRASVRANIAPSTLESPHSTLDTASAGRVYRMQGDASVDYQFRRTWHASARAQRSVEYLAVLTEPILSDAVSLGLQGLPTRRLDLLATAGYAAGVSAENQDSKLDSYTASARVRYALTRSLALYGEYVYLNYDLRGQQWQAVGLASRLELHGVRFGVMVWAAAF